MYRYNLSRLTVVELSIVYVELPDYECVLIDNTIIHQHFVYINSKIHHSPKNILTIPHYGKTAEPDIDIRLVITKQGNASL